LHSKRFGPEDDRVQVVITVVRQSTGNFRVDIASREGFEAPSAPRSSTHSATRLLWFVDRMVSESPLAEELFRLIHRRWGAELSYAPVLTAELLEPPEQPMAR
jgi:hypothetical protein